MAYVRGMGQAACDPGYQPSADGTVCEQTVTLGDMCVGSSFPWVGTIAPGGACVPFSPLLGYAALGILGLAILKGRR